MGLLNRASNIFRGNINNVLDKIEDPEAAVNQIIRDFEKGIVQSRNAIAGAMAEIKMRENKVYALTSKRDGLLQIAQNAILKSDDEEASAALMEKQSIENSLGSILESMEQSKAESKRALEDYRELELALVEARTKRDTIVARKRDIQVKQSLLKATESLGSGAGFLNSGNMLTDAENSIARLEEKIALKSAKIDAQRNMIQSTNQFNSQRAIRKIQIESELENMKNSLLKSPEPEPEVD